MANFDLMRQLAKPTGGKIIMLVMDGVGGMPMEDGGMTALEAATTPNMDRLAREGTLGAHFPIARGITPGSGPAHLSLFGYDPLAKPVGRGVFSALGVGLDFGEGDVAARGNFVTVDGDGLITDRRAGRIGEDISAPLVAKLDQIKIDGVGVDVRVVKEYRFVTVLRGEGLNGSLADTDPQVTGKAPLPATALVPEAQKTAEIFQQFIDQAQAILKDESPANMISMRGFGEDPGLPKYADIYKLKAACCAVYPMYRGVARLVGMDVLDTGKNPSPAEQIQVVADNWDDYDFFFIHIKPTDSKGEDGNFEGKSAVIDRVDQALPTLLNLNPDVMIVTGDHSTPAKMKSHSWHPVPTMIWAPETHLQDQSTRYGERQAARGGLGHFHGTELMQLAMAHAKRLAKYGA